MTAFHRNPVIRIRENGMEDKQFTNYQQRDNSGTAHSNSRPTYTEFIRFPGAAWERNQDRNSKRYGLATGKDPRTGIDADKIYDFVDELKAKYIALEQRKYLLLEEDCRRKGETIPNGALREPMHEPGERNRIAGTSTTEYLQFPGLVWMHNKDPNSPNYYAADGYDLIYCISASAIRDLAAKMTMDHKIMQRKVEELLAKQAEEENKKTESA